MQQNSSKQLKILEKQDIYHSKGINIPKLMAEMTECTLIDRNVLKGIIRDCKKITCTHRGIPVN